MDGFLKFVGICTLAYFAIKACEKVKEEADRQAALTPSSAS